MGDFTINNKNIHLPIGVKDGPGGKDGPKMDNFTVKEGKKGVNSGFRVQNGLPASIDKNIVSPQKDIIKNEVKSKVLKEEAKTKEVK